YSIVRNPVWRKLARQEAVPVHVGHRLHPGREYVLQYLLAWRMRLARKALHEEDTPVAAIAWRLGYASESAFSAAFKRSSSNAPGRYRQQKRVTAISTTPI
ncbi:helix-turn-helix domain-containing protein, partial [Bacillus licheniformis]|uniref:helix-turn-helix domain-containing protein n=1 Tax=Bacillus licheniformis TaxID=1402 RepID=UPI00237C778D